MKRSIASLLLSLAVSLPAFAQESNVVSEPASSLIDFDETGRVADAPSRKAASLQLDAFAAFAPTEPDVKLGIGLVVWKNATMRATVGALNGGVGAGLAYRLVPVIDLSLGLGGMYEVRDGRVVPYAFVSVAHW